MTTSITRLKQEGPQIRLLICSTCKTIEELPDYQGHPDHDDLLAVSCERHQNALGVTHVGNLMRVPLAQWVKPAVKEQIIKQIRDGVSGGLDDADQGWYDTKSTFHEDALTCYQQHLRPKGQCPDYMSDKKKLLPNTKAERKELGLASVKYSPNATRLCNFCLTGDTEVVTRNGIERIEDLSGKTSPLLIPFRDTTQGSFLPTEVHYFGVQPTFEVTLRKGKSTKTVRTTAEHRWILADVKGSATGETTTAALRSGDRLRGLKAVPPRGKENIVPFGVAQGFVFGDGSRGSQDRRPACVTFYSDKGADLLPYFSTCLIKDIFVNGSWHKGAVGLPRFWKDVPSLDDSRSFLLSWLAGYFAADGTVDRNGVSIISSARIEHLQFVKSVAAVCGIGNNPITEKLREGFGKESLLYGLTLNARDLPEWFWIREKHRLRFEERLATPERYKQHWLVEGVVATGEDEPVYCAVVPGAGAFGLADDLMTGNCPVHTYNVTRARAEGGMYK